MRLMSFTESTFQWRRLRGNIECAVPVIGGCTEEESLSAVVRGDK